MLGVPSITHNSNAREAKLKSSNHGVLGLKTLIQGMFEFFLSLFHAHSIRPLCHGAALVIGVIPSFWMMSFHFWLMNSPASSKHSSFGGPAHCNHVSNMHFQSLLHFGGLFFPNENVLIHRRSVAYRILFPVCFSIQTHPLTPFR